MAESITVFKLKMSPLGDRTTNVPFSHSSPQLLLASSWDSIVRQYDISFNSQGMSYTHPTPVLDFAFKNQAQVLSGGLDNSLKLYDVNSRQERQVGRHENARKCVEYSDDNNVIVTGSWDGSVKVWDERANSHCTGTFAQADKVNSMGVVGEVLVVGTAARKVWLWDLRNTSCPQQKRESSFCHSETVQIWDLRNTKYAMKSFPDHSDSILPEVCRDNRKDDTVKHIEMIRDKTETMEYKVNIVALETATTVTKEVKMDVDVEQSQSSKDEVCLLESDMLFVISKSKGQKNMMKGFVGRVVLGYNSETIFKFPSKSCLDHFLLSNCGTEIPNIEELQKKNIRKLTLNGKYIIRVKHSLPTNAKYTSRSRKENGWCWDLLGEACSFELEVGGSKSTKSLRFKDIFCMFKFWTSITGKLMEEVTLEDFWIS